MSEPPGVKAAPAGAPVPVRHASVRVALGIGNGGRFTCARPHLDGSVAALSVCGAELHVRGDMANGRPAVDEVLELSFQFPGWNFACVARVCWLMPGEQGCRLGVSFDHADSLDMETGWLRVEDVRIDPAWALKVPANLARRRRVLPLCMIQGVVHVACADPDDKSAVQAVERLLGEEIRPWRADEEALGHAIAHVYGSATGGMLAQSASHGRRTLSAFGTQDAVALSEEILSAAYLRRASDIHIDPYSRHTRIRLRVDGKLETYSELPLSVHAELISRYKVLSNIDIAERRAPQDGRFRHSFGDNHAVDIRAAILPTKHGERMTLRLLALETEALTLDRLGFDAGQYRLIEEFLRRNQGLAILTGPTGSGKTTTLYAAIRLLLKHRDVNILTVEDPIEYEIEGVAQCEVDSADKVSFSKALRSILRHDPDVVMIGEIRDKETADIALKAALTGHLVFSTLHTNSAISTITRLLDMGVQPYLAAATLRIAVAQRLLRRLCKRCRMPRPLLEREAAALRRPELAGQTVYEPGACLYCAGRGYSGRVGVYELLMPESSWATRLADGASEDELADSMRPDDSPALIEHAIAKLLNGETSTDEVMQIVASW